MFCGKRLFSAVLLFCTLSLGAASDDNLFFAARRDSLMKRVEGSIAVLRGAADTRGYVPFRQNNDFYYLTGVETPGAFLIVDSVEKESILFLPPRDSGTEQWEGARLFAGRAAAAATGIEQVRDVQKLEAELVRRRRGAAAVYTPLRAEETAATSRDRASRHDLLQESNPWDGRPSREKAFEASLKKKVGTGVTVRDLSPVLDAMRRIKDEQEIQRMREASRIGAIGLNEAMRTTRPGIYEYQIAAVADFIFRWEGAQGQAYFPLVGSGANSCVVHYYANARMTISGDIIVMDFGPDYKYYQSDITRTFPVSGKFTEEQRQVYAIVLEAQKAALAKVRAGSTIRGINEAGRAVVDRAGYGKYWLHGVSHYIGLATHDVGGPEPFEPGVAITVEPGIYIPEKNLGIRIEDTVLVTREGCEILSRGVPKEITEIEKLMTERGLYPKNF